MIHLEFYLEQFLFFYWLKGTVNFPTVLPYKKNINDCQYVPVTYNYHNRKQPWRSPSIWTLLRRRRPSNWQVWLISGLKICRKPQLFGPLMRCWFMCCARFAQHVCTPCTRSALFIYQVCESTPQCTFLTLSLLLQCISGQHGLIVSVRARAYCWDVTLNVTCPHNKTQITPVPCVVRKIQQCTAHPTYQVRYKVHCYTICNTCRQNAMHSTLAHVHVE